MVAVPIGLAERYSHVFTTRRGAYMQSGWSEWARPDFISLDREVMFKVLSGAHIKKDSEARPRILARFKTESFLEYLYQSKEERAANLESCPLDRND